ncbi:MAG: AbrB/MazE/SpoVT family DNA-binding domain-containing protein [Acidobacteriota bacterium]|nr:AbrB/MazE/SpoVT family DNA-binding domain-containing protein [Acidobacteriota bacterium]MDQ5873581.1 AbrB/MazE/SpoVT family DNA-binding domain-containing protein [Acidobacteriota bacterium]
MERKIVQIGSSLAVTLPSEVVKEFKLKKGQTVEVSIHPQNGAVTIRPGIKYFDDGKVTKRFRAEADRLLKERQQLYRNLAK